MKSFWLTAGPEESRSELSLAARSGSWIDPSDERFSVFEIETNSDGTVAGGIAAPNHTPHCVSRIMQLLGNGKLVDRDSLVEIESAFAPRAGEHQACTNGLHDFLTANMGKYVICSSIG